VLASPAAGVVAAVTLRFVATVVGRGARCGMLEATKPDPSSKLPSGSGAVARPSCGEGGCKLVSTDNTSDCETQADNTAVAKHNRMTRETRATDLGANRDGLISIMLFNNLLNVDSAPESLALISTLRGRKLIIYNDYVIQQLLECSTIGNESFPAKQLSWN